MPAYETVANLRAQMNKTNTDDDAILALILDAASRAIDNFCNRPDGFRAASNATARLYTGSGRNWQKIDQCIEITLVEVKESIESSTYTAWAATDWIAMSGDHHDPDFNSLPYDAVMVDPTGDEDWFTGVVSSRDAYFDDVIPGGRSSLGDATRARAPTVRVTARWGYAEETPEPIRQATAAQATIIFKRMEGAMASTLATADLGTIEAFSEIDPLIGFLLQMGRYVKPATGRR